MIKLIRPAFSHNKRNASYCALSTDEIPDYLKDGDEVYLIDSGIYTYYDSSSGELVSEEISSNPLFVITLTPTAEDLSGTMDKTPTEINDAIRDTKRILFDIPAMGAIVEATQFENERIDGSGKFYAAANITYGIDGQPVLIQVVTNIDSQTYRTTINILTPMT